MIIKRKHFQFFAESSHIRYVYRLYTHIFCETQEKTLHYRVNSKLSLVVLGPFFFYLMFLSTQKKQFWNQKMEKKILSKFPSFDQVVFSPSNITAITQQMDLAVIASVERNKYRTNLLQNNTSEGNNPFKSFGMLTQFLISFIM